MQKSGIISSMRLLGVGVVLFFSFSLSSQSNNAVFTIESKHNHSETHLRVLQKKPEIFHMEMAGLALQPVAPDEISSACTGVFISYSTESGEVAADGNGNNSPYTQALAGLLTQADLTLQKMSKIVRKEVIDSSISKPGSTLPNQQPMYVDATGCDYQLADKSDTRARIALVIGNSNYSNVTKLKNPENDAELIAPKLLRLNFDVNLLIDGNYKQMNNAIAELKKNAKNSVNGSVVVIFYAGHGFEVSGRQYWAPVDIPANKNKFDDIVGDVIPFTNLMGNDVGNKSLIIIFNDTVRDNPFTTPGR